MSISIKEVVRTQIQKIASVFSTPVIEKKDGTAFSFLTPLGFCLIGYTIWDIEDGFFDLRWRLFLGEVLPSFNPWKMLMENDRCADNTFALQELDDYLVLTLTDNHRFLFSWEAEKIQRVIDIRFGCGAFALQFVCPGIKPLSEQFFQQALQNHGFDVLLSRATVLGWKE